MGCPASIGPEIIVRYFAHHRLPIDTVVLGDMGVLVRCAAELGLDLPVFGWQPGQVTCQWGIPVLELSAISRRDHQWGRPNSTTGKAMADYIVAGVRLIQEQQLTAMVTCPIAKSGLHQAGYHYPGHTEMLASLTGTSRYTMMLAGPTLRVTLATIHCSLAEVPRLLTTDRILDLIRITHGSLRTDFGLAAPRLAVAGLNPHSGENGLFGNEETTIIAPAVHRAINEGIDVSGPYPPDTVYFKAARGGFDAVVSMYHDQGLIPFKLLHFHDGVNVTLGLPIVRTSVDHGTAYDIAGKGMADATSLSSAVAMAAQISGNRHQFQTSKPPA